MQRQIFKKTCSLMINVCVLTVCLWEKCVPDHPCSQGFLHSHGIWRKKRPGVEDVYGIASSKFLIVNNRFLYFFSTEKRQKMYNFRHFFFNRVIIRCIYCHVFARSQIKYSGELMQKQRKTKNYTEDEKIIYRIFLPTRTALDEPLLGFAVAGGRRRK